MVFNILIAAPKQLGYGRERLSAMLLLIPSLLLEILLLTSFIGNGSQLTGITAAIANTVTDNAQPNITSVGTLTSLSVTGNANVGNIGATNGVFTSVSGNGAALTALNASNISSGTLAQARLANSNVILGNTTLALGTTTTTVTGLASVTSTTFIGSLTGAATTAGSPTKHHWCWYIDFVDNQRN
jgi:hypothetical protein